MLVIGTMGIPFTRDKGTFYCPRCRADVPYRGRHVRRFLTLYFIPLIPLDKQEEYVECRQCKNHFPREVLAHSAAAATQAFYRYARYVIALVAAADGQITPGEVSAFQDLIRRLTGVMPSLEEALSEIQAAAGSRQMPSWYLRTINGFLTKDEKKVLVQQAFLMASVEGRISETRNSLLADFPAALALSEDEFKQAIAEAVAIE